MSTLVSMREHALSSGVLDSGCGGTNGRGSPFQHTAVLLALTVFSGDIGVFVQTFLINMVLLILAWASNRSDRYKLQRLFGLPFRAVYVYMLLEGALPLNIGFTSDTLSSYFIPLLFRLFCAGVVLLDMIKGDLALLTSCMYLENRLVVKKKLPGRVYICKQATGGGLFEGAGESTTAVLKNMPAAAVPDGRGRRGRGGMNNSARFTEESDLRSSNRSFMSRLGSSKGWGTGSTVGVEYQSAVIGSNFQNASRNGENILLIADVQGILCVLLPLRPDDVLKLTKRSDVDLGNVPVYSTQTFDDLHSNLDSLNITSPVSKRRSGLRASTGLMGAGGGSIIEGHRNTRTKKVIN